MVSPLPLALSPGAAAPAAVLAPLHRVATPEDITEACLALITTRYATGQTFLVDGGLGLAV